MTQSQYLKLNLSHPLNQKTVELPHNLLYEKYYQHDNLASNVIDMYDQFAVKKFVLSASPSWTSDYMVMVLYSSEIMAFCRPEETMNEA